MSTADNQAHVRAAIKDLRLASKVWVEWDPLNTNHRRLAVHLLQAGRLGPVPQGLDIDDINSQALGITTLLEHNSAVSYEEYINRMNMQERPVLEPTYSIPQEDDGHAQF